MFTFIIGALGGAALGSSYVLLNTPRSGKENQQLVKNYIEEAKVNAEIVSQKSTNLQNSVSNLTSEIESVSQNFVPEIMETIDTFSTESEVYTNRINNEITEINAEINDLSERIQAK